ncbi:hypothetical protein BpHYR1_011775 [Brachionus plicatilis]|uniref:Uncharacterized protein n=1 Tax=Brachionus plicatilis TaxID=10195 RepID=A0A3M7Q4R7_BRAPC|nr:hypothetical protein BpHYR1_011775 [Brachionus plicatilis]
MSIPSYFERMSDYFEKYNTYYLRQKNSSFIFLVNLDIRLQWFIYIKSSLISIIYVLINSNIFKKI